MNSTAINCLRTMCSAQGWVPEQGPSWAEILVGREDRETATHEIIAVRSKSYEGNKMGSQSSEGLDGPAATSEMSRVWLGPEDREESRFVRPGSQAGVPGRGDSAEDLGRGHARLPEEHRQACGVGIWKWVKEGRERAKLGHGAPIGRGRSLNFIFSAI